VLARIGLFDCDKDFWSSINCYKDEGALDFI